MTYQRIQTNSRLETEQIHSKREILDAGAASNLPTTSSGGLDVFYRSARRIRPCSSVHETSHISTVSSLGSFQHFQFKVFLFGLKSAPQTFSKCMAVVAAFLRKQRIFIYPYLDDWLLKSSSPALLQTHLSYYLQLLNRLDLHVNYKKSIFNPTQRIHYLGASLDTAKASMCPSEEKLFSIHKKCHQLLHTQHPTVRQVSSLLGSMASSIFIVPNATLNMCPLQQCLEDQWKQISGRWEDQVVLHQSAKDSIRWWMKRSHLMKGVPFHRDPPTQAIVTDASLQGCGAHMGPLQVEGLW